MLGPGWKRWVRVATWMTFVVLFGVALFLLSSGIAGAVRSSDLDERGVEVPAEVLDVTVDPGGDTGPSSYVRVRFKLRGDQRHFVTTSVAYQGDFEDDHPRALRNGTRIEYDPEEPEKARIVGESDDWLDRIVAGALFTLLIPVLAVLYRRYPHIFGW